jgi:hypothetical protein
MRTVLGRRKRREGEQPQSQEDVYRRLRTQALSSVDNGLAAPSAEHAQVSGLVIDIPAQGGFATVVALTDDTTSMYTSTGGGTIGAGQHAVVAAATHRLLSVVQGHLGEFTHKDDGALPPSGSVRFHVLTPSGSRFEDVPEDSFWGRAPHVLMSVIAATQELVSTIREASSR